jgi:predicted phage terminase large subunit-like protein
MRGALSTISSLPQKWVWAFVVLSKENNMTEKPYFGPCSEKQRLVLTDNTTDVLLIGGGAGGGKTFLSLVKALKYVQTPHAKVLIMRLTYPLLKATGGIVEESHHIYPHFGAQWKVQPLEWVFPNGSTIKFVAMPKERKDVQGWQPTHVLLDEGAEWVMEDVLAVNERVRSARYNESKGGKMSMIITCNPDRHSWLYNWVEWCLDRTTGVPVPGTENIVRWFVNLSGKIYWGSSPEDLYEKYGKGKTMGKDFIPKSFRFIPMTVYDNPILLKNNPGYLANLLGGTRVSQLRYLLGSWTAVVEGTSYFQRGWLPLVKAAPPNVQRVRSWDLAASVPSEVNPDPDYTAGVMLSRSSEGVYYVEHAKRDRRLTDGVLKMIAETAFEDGLDVPVTIPKDSGAGGAAANMFFTKHLIEQGLTVRSVKMSGHSGKVQRFLPFASMCEAGHVRLVEGDWNEDFLSELEAFTGNRNDHDDFVDATSDAFNTLCKQVTIPTFAIPDLSQPSPIIRN